MKVALVGVVLGLALVPLGCGGDNESSAMPTAEWAEGYCTAIVDWTAERGRVTDELRDYPSLSQVAFEQAGADLRSATEAFIAELRDLGAPDTAFGPEAREVVDAFATATEGEVADIEQAIENSSDLPSVSRAIISITAALTSIHKSFTTMANSLVTLDPERELHTALEKAPSCDELSDR